MRRIILLFIPIVFLANIAMAEDKPLDPQRFFYQANTLYEKREYEKAAEEYARILQSGVESAPLYYNLGNAFFKMGKIGYAILSYEKASLLMPGDSDLRSNLRYAKSLTEDSALQVPSINKLAWVIKLPFRDLNLNEVAIITMTLYIILICLAIAGIINHTFRRRATFIFYILLILFMVTLAAFSVRYYEEQVLKHGIVVAKEAECKYEPIEKSTTYYTLKDGQEVSILNTRNGWRRIRRLDGKLGWVKADAVEEID